MESGSFIRRRFAFAHLAMKKLSVSSLTSAGRPSAPINPVRDWRVLRWILGILFIGILGWNAWALATVMRGEALISNPRSAPTVLDRSALDTIRGVFEARTSEELKYRTGVYKFADPSQ